MDTLNPTKLKRDAAVIKSKLRKVGKSIVVKENMRVMFPERYTNIDLALLGPTVRVVSMYAILDEQGNYAVANLPIFVSLTPNRISNIEVNGVVNKVLEFEAGTVMLENDTPAIDNRFLYDLFKEYITNGKIPWFFEYTDLLAIFVRASKYANSNIGANPIPMEVLASVVARSSKDKNIPYRESLLKPSDTKTPPDYIGLLNIYYTFDNTVSKLVGSYYGKAVTSALINKETATTKIEEILRA